MARRLSPHRAGLELDDHGGMGWDGGTSAGVATLTSTRAGSCGGFMASHRCQLRIEEQATPMDWLKSARESLLPSKASTHSRHFWMVAGLLLGFQAMGPPKTWPVGELGGGGQMGWLSACVVSPEVLIEDALYCCLYR